MSLDPQIDGNKYIDSSFDPTDKLIFNHFLQPSSPHLYISYKTFKKHFPISTGNYPIQNRNIIDTHLKYHNYVFNQMMPYKWVPVFIFLCFKVLRFRTPPTAFPIFYVVGFDYYFRSFFLWMYQDQPFINMRNQFITKLSKQKTKIRRKMLFFSMFKQLRANEKVPEKFIKFGKQTQYILHTRVHDIEQSNFFLLPIFQQYMFLNNFSLSSVQKLWDGFKGVVNKFREYRSLPKEQRTNLLLIDNYPYSSLLKHGTIDQQETYSIQKPSALLMFRIRRFGEILNYALNKQIKSSSFELESLTVLNQHYHLTEQYKFGLQSNVSDLGVYYALITLPFIAIKLMKRR